jgi:drug/metabolite transporter (DMT)-like permease
MDPVLVATLCGLTAAICYGVGDWLTPRGRRKLSPWQINFLVSFCGAIIALLVFALSLPHHMPAADVWIKAIAYSAFVSAGYLFFVRALTIGAIGVVVPLSGTYPMITLALSVLILNDVFSVGQVVAMGLIVAGAAFLAYEKNYRKLPLRQLHEANIYTALAVLVWGVGFFLLNPLFGKVDWRILLLLLDGSGLIIAAVVMAAIYKKQAVREVRYALTDRTVWTAASLLGTGTVALYLGAGKTGNVIIPAVISSLSPLLSSALEAYIDKKRLGILKRAGAVLAVGGIVLLNIS